MSVESAKAFLKKVSQDADFRASLENAPDEAARKEIIKSSGYDFTREEVESLLPSSNAEGKLSESELTAVAGGDTAGWVAAGTAILTILIG